MPDTATNGPASVDGPATPYGGLLSTQDVTIANEPKLGHGLWISFAFTASRAATYEETPGQPTGCKVWVYDLSRNPPAPPTDQGAITVSGVEGGTVSCRFDAHDGYLCPTASGTASISVTHDGTAAHYAVSAAEFSVADVGRYLRITGASLASNNGDFPILETASKGALGVLNAAAQQEDFMGAYTVLAGMGPTPDPSVVVYPPGPGVTLHLTPGGVRAFAFPDVGPVVPGGAFTVDDATRPLLTNVPIDGSVVTLGCGGAGGQCDAATATVIRMTTTDGSTDGLTTTEMPKAVHEQVELQCATLGGSGVITVPADAMRLFSDSNRRSAMTRVRTAFMREGVGFGVNTEGMPPNRATVLVGHGVLGFTDP
jgi:hypothetical protein